MKDSLQHQCGSAAACLAITLCAALILTSASLLAGFPLTQTSARAIVILCISLAAVLANRSQASVRVWLVLLAVLVIMGASDAWLIDYAYDSQEYHFDAIYALHHGWNPYWQDYAPFAPPGASILPWPQYYPIGSWLLVALLWTAGLPLEASKVALGIPLLISPLAVFAALGTLGASRRQSILIAIVAAIPPFALTQFWTRYVDGMLTELLIGFLAFSILAIRMRSALAVAAAISCMAVALNIKANAIPIFAAACAGMCVIAFASAGWRRSLQMAGIFGGAAVAAMLTIGFHPYVTNALRHGNPFFPVIGGGSYDFTTMIEPVGLRGEPAPLQVLLSLASASGAAIVHAKMPFTLSPKEITAAAYPGTFVGGFGPWFSGTVLLALLAGALSLHHHRRSTYAVFTIAGLFVVCALATPIGWVARYVPELWVATFLIAGDAALGTGGAVRGFGWAALATLAINSLAIGTKSAMISYVATSQIRSNIIQARREGPFCGAFGGAHARIQLMRDAGVTVIPLPNALPLRCRDARPIPAAYDLFDVQGESCPCNEIAHDPLGRWSVKPDTTAQDIARYSDNRE